MRDVVFVAESARLAEDLRQPFRGPARCVLFQSMMGFNDLEIEPVAE